MRFVSLLASLATIPICAGEPPPAPPLIEKPEAFETLVNPACSHCRDEAKRRSLELKSGDRVLSWIRGYSDGGTIPYRFFLAPYRVISDSYGVFVYDPDAGYSRGFAPSYDFRFHGWRNGVMVMKHKDGTLYSCLTGVAFDGPKKGTRLTPIPTLVSDWGVWLEKYPNAVAYHMFDKFQPTDLPTRENPDSVKSRGPVDPRWKGDAEVLGVRTEKTVRAYPISALEKDGPIHETLGDESVVVLWEPRTRTASAYRPVARQPRKYKAPAPDSTGVSKLDEGTPTPPGTAIIPPRTVVLALSPPGATARFRDAETHSLWDVAGRCVEGELKGWTLDWVDSVQVKGFAWAAEYPQTTIYSDPKPKTADEANRKVKEVAGTAEFLRLLPKPWATLKAIDVKARTVTLRLDGESASKVWPLEPDAEIKIAGWWGRLEQFTPDQRVWVWLALDRNKQPKSVAMIADETSEKDIHGTNDAVGELQRAKQKTWLAERWRKEGLPGTLSVKHVFSGEVEVLLDHESMRWARSLQAGDEVAIAVDPPIRGIVKFVVPWRERTVVRLVVGELQASDLAAGQRLDLKMTPGKGADDSPYPPDIDRPRTATERVEWFLASTYCVCGVGKDICTGMFFTLASCNPNGCGAPQVAREELKGLMEKGLTDRQIWDALAKDRGPLMARPHLRK